MTRVQILLTHSVIQAILSLAEGKGVLSLISHIKHLQGNQ